MKTLFRLLPAVVLLVSGVTASQASAASRSINVTIVNNTGATLHLTSFDKSSGVYDQNPPDAIPNGGQGSFEIESNGFLTGAIGSCVYQIEGNGGLVSLAYADPHVGGNHYETNAPPGFAVNQAGGSGDNASVTFSVVKK